MSVENTVEKEEISLFSTVFSKDIYCRHEKRGLVWEWVNKKQNTDLFILNVFADENFKKHFLTFQLDNSDSLSVQCCLGRYQVGIVLGNQFPRDNNDQQDRNSWQELRSFDQLDSSSQVSRVQLYHQNWHNSSRQCRGHSWRCQCCLCWVRMSQLGRVLGHWSQFHNSGSLNIACHWV